MQLLRQLCLLAFVLQLLAGQMATKSSGIQLQQIVCESLDKNFVDFTACRIDGGENDTKAAMNVKASLLQEASDIKVRLQLLRKVNKQFKPFVYDDIIDICGFLLNINNGKRDVFWSLVYPLVIKYTNINHTCPFNHDIVANHFVFDDAYFSMIPIPKGEYLVRMAFIVNQVQRCRIRVYSART